MSSFNLLLCGLALLIGLSGVAQTFFSPWFACGLSAGWENNFWLACAVLQGTLYLAASRSVRCARWYDASQLIVLILLVVTAGQFAAAYPLTALGAGVLALFGLAITYRRAPTALGALSFTAIFVLVVPLIITAFLQVLLYRATSAPEHEGVPVTTAEFLLIATMAVVLSALLIVRTMPTMTDRLAGLTWRSLPPLVIALLAMLRAKLPDVAYDSLWFKGTFPYLLSDWRTAIVAAPDLTLVGTNLQELLNGAVRIAAPDYYPPLISTGVYLVLPLFATLFAALSRFSPEQETLRRFVVLFICSMTEALLAQGTAYHEPLLLAFLVLGATPTPLAGIFLAAAFAVKPSALFAFPIIAFVLWRERELVTKPRAVLIGALVLGGVIVGGQIARNQAFTGRILGHAEPLAWLTDPRGQVLERTASHFDQSAPRGGVVNNALLAACNIIGHDALCATEYEGNNNRGFHMFPASRGGLLGFLSACMLLTAAVRRRAARLAVPALLFLVGYWWFYGNLTEGRHHLPLSFGFVLLLLLTREAWSLSGTLSARLWLGALIAIVTGELFSGLNLNVSWECRRKLFTAVSPQRLDRPREGVERFIAETVRRYRRDCSKRQIVPTVVTDDLTVPYLGAHVIPSPHSYGLVERYLRAHPHVREKMARSILLVVSQHAGFLEQLVGGESKDYAPCFREGEFVVYCSLKLRPHGARCARSMLEHELGMFDE